MSQEILNSAVRHVLTTGGSYLMTHGYISSGTWEIVSGLVLVVSSYAWSVVEKKMKAAQ